MRTARVLALAAILALEPFCALAASYHFEPNPEGEKVYMSGQWQRMAPVATIVAGGMVLAAVLWVIRRKVRKLKGAAHHG